MASGGVPNGCAGKGLQPFTMNGDGGADTGPHTQDKRGNGGAENTMSDVTIKQLAQKMGMPSEKLLTQLDAAGMKFSDPEQVISSTEKVKLLGFLRRSNAKGDAASAADSAPRHVTLRRRTVGELKVATPGPRGTASTAKTVNVEVRAKRTYVKRSVIVEEANAEPEREDAVRKLEESRLQREREDQERAQGEQRRNAQAHQREAAKVQATRCTCRGGQHSVARGCRAGGASGGG